MSFYNNKYTKWLVGALVLMNMVLLFAFFTARPHIDEPKRERHSEIIQKFLQKELNLTDDQAVKFKELRTAHFAERKEQWNAIRALKKEMMDALSTETPDTEKAKTIADKIGELEAGKEKMLIEHYLKLQAECTPEQREKLASVFKKSMKQKKKSYKKRGERKEAN